MIITPHEYSTVRLGVESGSSYRIFDYPGSPLIDRYPSIYLSLTHKHTFVIWKPGPQSLFISVSVAHIVEHGTSNAKVMFDSQKNAWTDNMYTFNAGHLEDLLPKAYM